MPNGYPKVISARYRRAGLRLHGVGFGLLDGGFMGLAQIGVVALGASAQRLPWPAPVPSRIREGSPPAFTVPRTRAVEVTPQPGFWSRPMVRSA